jgi:hypothetical protein
MDTLMGKIATVCTSSGNPITFETNID